VIGLIKTAPKAESCGGDKNLHQRDKFKIRFQNIIWKFLTQFINGEMQK
jgi:hypothetical protein